MNPRLIYSVLLVFILISPLVYQSIIQTGNFNSVCMACEEQNEEGEEKKKVDVEKIILNNQQNLLALSSKYFNHPSINKTFSSVNNEVFTPPPELI